IALEPSGTPERPDRLHQPPQPIALLQPELGPALEPRLAGRVRRPHREYRHLVDHQWELLDADGRPGQGRPRLDIQRSDGLTQLLPLDPGSERRAHALEDPDETRPGGI